MTATMYDAAYFKDYAGAKRHGAAALSHYLTRGYEYTSPQVAATRAAGMGALHNMEGYAAELKGASRAKGRTFAEEALAAVGRDVPRDGTVGIPYSVDVDLTDLTVCDAAFAGINDVHRSSVGRGIKVQVYGEGGLIMRLHKLGLVQGKQWLSMSEGFGGFQAAMQSGVVGIVQMHNAAGQWIGTDLPGTDRNTIIDPLNSGIWWPAGSVYDTTGAADMPLTDADIQKIAREVWSYPISSQPTGAKGEVPVKWTAAGWLTSVRRQATGANVKALAVQQAMLSAVTNFDAAAAAKDLRDRFMAMIGGK